MICDYSKEYYFNFLSFLYNLLILTLLYYSENFDLLSLQASILFPYCIVTGNDVGVN